MDQNLISQVIAYSLPALIMGLIAYAVLYNFFNYNLKIKHLESNRETKKHSLDLRLQAYERMVLFLERISPEKLLIRISPITEDKMVYLETLVNVVESEYEHNLTQQIYLNSETWHLITSAKNAIIHLLKNQALSESVKTASDFQKAVFEAGIKEQSPTSRVLSIIRQEVLDLL